MEHEPVETTEAGTLVLPVTDVDGRILEYARLGLRIVRHDSKRAVVELPCGVLLVLSRRAAPRRVTAA
jgi:hypothetical protein